MVACMRRLLDNETNTACKQLAYIGSSILFARHDSTATTENVDRLANHEFWQDACFSQSPSKIFSINIDLPFQGSLNELHMPGELTDRS